MMEPNASSVPTVNIVGDKVALGPLRRDLVPVLTRWSNDLAARRNITTPLPQTLEHEDRAL